MAKCRSAASCVRSLLLPSRPSTPFSVTTRRKNFRVESSCFDRNSRLETAADLKFLRFFSTMISGSLLEYTRKSLKSSPSTVVVEGNIGSGKGQILNYFSNFPAVEACEEPVHLWRNKDGQNLLDLMYKDPKANSFVFQQYVLETMLNIHDRERTKPVRIVERSFYSGRYIFTENLKRNDLLTDSEYEALDAKFKSRLDGGENTPQVDLIVYIRTDPVTARERIMKRGRKEELGISVDYLCQIHDRHEEWLTHGKFPIPAPVLVIDGNGSLKEVHEQLRKHKDRILFGWSDSPSGRISSPAKREAESVPLAALA